MSVTTTVTTYPERMASRTRATARRRQRSVRVTVSVALLGVASALVLLTLPTQSPLLLSIASVGAIVLSWAALRMMWTEVLQSRREHAAERVAQATTYKRLFSERAEEHASFTSAMTDNLAAAQHQVHEYAGALEQERRLRAQTEVTLEATTKELVAEHKHNSELESRVVRLQAEVEAAADDALASWEATRMEEAAKVADAVSKSHTA